MTSIFAVTGARPRGGRARFSIATLPMLAALAGCSLDVTNPNAPTEGQILTTTAGLRAVAIGMQGRFGNAIEESVFIPGLISGELGNTTLSQSPTREFQRFPDASANSKIEDTNVELADLWTKSYGVVRSADDVLATVDKVQLAPGTKSGMTALARTLKAWAFGTLIESFQKIPLETTTPNPAFVDRAAVLTATLGLLAAARTDLAAQAPTTDFTGSILAVGFDLPNTIRALQARYSLAAGAYEQALAFANEVPAAATSIVTYTTVDRNALRDDFYGQSLFAALSTFRANAEAGDTRVNRFTTAATPATLAGATLNGLNIYKSDSDPFPVFTQDELTLIRAEAHARASRLPEAIAEVNKVRQAAGLAAKDATSLPNAQSVLDEIYRQRTYSLYLAGLHWADQRRFGRIAEAKVAYLPYPFAERSTNSSVPANP